MHLLSEQRKSIATRDEATGLRSSTGIRRAGILGRALLATCAHPGCASAWLHPLRSRSAPVFEDGWSCSAECSRARIHTAIAREMAGRSPERPVHRHRIPLGLLMLEQEWINQAQLRAALTAQKQAGTGRIGGWLIKQGAVKEETVTRALALQWSCPVLSCDCHTPGSLTAVMPRLFVDAFGALPLRFGGSGVLYLGFEGAPDPALALGIRRMTGLRVECGVIAESQFRPAVKGVLDAAFPPVSLIEAVSPAAAALTLAREVERTRPVASRLVRVHDYLWLRQWLRKPAGGVPEQDAIRDLVCSIVPKMA